MTTLTVDPISAKTLPALDRLFESDKDKLTSIIMATEAVPLRRLLLAAIARNQLLGEVNDPNLSSTMSFLERLIRINLIGDPSTLTLANFNELLDEVGINAERLMLSAAITRYMILQY